MEIGIVVGRLTATRKDENLVGTKLLITQPIDVDGSHRSHPIVTVDTVGAGVGEKVIYVLGSTATNATPKKNAPIDAAIVGIIDSIDC
ncbi:ethanolamine utilization protein EutN [Neobacillus notoginsengisoli]|uniref:Ethanolamine utilization protein EutN n=1 Tax=Neobacillus notoginsengisoli TaxID=1578198 RepID=A0A417YW77_9BACI|nr:EutN/CcmL family microcompartment protein [Neobacillus notoginsengisoli]RHW41596.1 ethanolamine utilization protein EutN [Neobacillus notoginsengisoli]